jgi:hypothetical protein
MVFVNSFSDENGVVTRHFLHEAWPLEVLNRLTFSEWQSKTTITLTGHPINATEAERKTFRERHKSMQAGFGGTMEQLAEYLKSM